MLRYPSVERIERTVKRCTLNGVRRLACAGTLLSGLKLQVQLAVGEIADSSLARKPAKFCPPKNSPFRKSPDVKTRASILEIAGNKIGSRPGISPNQKKLEGSRHQRFHF